MSTTTPSHLHSLAPMRRVTQASSLPSAAYDLARAGLPVFPCAPTAKQPLTQRGFRDATTDLDQVASWWERRPDANIGLPTGAVSGLDVVDVDLKGEDASGFPAWELARRAGLVSGWSMVVRTPSGGIHAYFEHAPGVEQRSWTSPRAHVDFRGDGGYVVVPPSWCSTTSGPRPYEVITVAHHAPSPVDSTALRAFLDPPRPTPPFLENATPGAGASPRRLADWVAALPEGGRNAGLHWAACRMVEGGFDLASTLGALGDAAQHAGLGVPEIDRTIRSAFRTTAPLPDMGGGGRRPDPTPEVSP